MPAFAQQQSQVQSNRLVSSARPDRRIGRPARDENPLVAQQQSLGNQTVQRLLRSRVIQTKLTINEPGDKYEQEADRIAEQVMRIPDPGTTKGAAVSGRARGAHLQRMCSDCEEELHRQPVEGEKNVLRSGGFPDQTARLTSDVEANINTLRNGGQPLPRSVRAFFEPRFGRDFSQVHVHADAPAANAAQVINARAFTLGRDIVFGTGQYAPDTRAGKQLLAHELVHVVQQRRSLRNPTVQRQAPVPAYRDCTPGITGIADANERLDAARLRAREFVGAARRRLAAAPAAGTTYAAALNRHFIAPTDADRATIDANYGQILFSLRVPNYICNSENICEGEQAFHIDDDDLVHVCQPFWSTSLTCRAIILIHEGAHDIGLGAGAHPPNRGSANYPAGNVAPPGGETTAGRMDNPDAYGFFAAHLWRETDTGSTCF
jgi:hypothetical protein